MNATWNNRRDFLIGLTGTVGALVTLPRNVFAETRPAELATIRLSDKMLAVLGPDANIVAADSGDGLMLVDGGHASWSEKALAIIAEEFPRRPVSTLFNTHWHPEQTGSNLRLGEQGAEIIAHENTKLWLGTEVWVRWSDTKYPALPEAARPTTTFIEAGSLKLAERKVEYGYMLNAHTDGDACVFFPDENVLVTGGFVSNDGWPIIDWWTGGWIGGMLDGFDSLLEVANADTRIVPANGPIMSLADLKRQQEMYLTIFDRLEELLRQALGTDEVLAAKPTAEFDAKWGDPSLFVTLAFQSTWGHLRDAYSKRLKNIP